jgi:cation diffusion facilitator family transporter
MRDVLAIYIIAFFVKLTAYLFSGYSVLLADSLHSIVDMTMIVLIYISSKFSLKAADPSHPFGHELARNLASLVVAVSFITVISFELFKEGISVILNPHSAYTNTHIAISAEFFVLGLLLLATFISSRREGVLNKTLLFESVNDSLSTLAAIIGIFLTFSGHVIFDGIATVAVATLIAFNSVKLVKENARFLMGFSPSDEFYRKVEDVCTGIGDVDGVHDMLGVYVGENAIHLDLHVTVDGEMKVRDADALSEKIVRELKKQIPEIKHVTVHFCPHTGERRKFVM